MRLPAYACLFLLLATPAFAQTTPQNLDFESGTIGQPPPGWTMTVLPATSHATLVTSADDPQAGLSSAKLTIKDANVAASLHQSFDATPYRGKLVLLRAAIRVQSTHLAHAGLWVGLDDAKGDELTERQSDESVYEGSWQIREVTFRVPPQTAKVSIHAYLNGVGSLGLDAVSFKIVTPEEMRYETPRALTDRGVVNLEALARLLGYVRFFHPSDQAANADWNDVAIAAVRKVEGAENTQELVEALQSIFQPLAPTLRIYATGATPDDATPHSGTEIVAWKNRGVRLGPGSNVYSSQRVTLTEPEAPLRADLPGGVSVIMPLSLYRDRNGTLPHEPVVAAPTEPGFVASGEDRTTRLADIILAWSVYQNFYPNFDYTPVDWSAQLANGLKAAATDATSEEFFVTLEKLIAPVNDSHGVVSFDNHIQRYLPARWDWVQGQVVITAAAPSTGLHPGDVVQKLDGRAVDDIIETDIDPIVCASTPQSRRSIELYWLRVNDGSPVALDVKTANARMLQTVVRPVASFYAANPGQPEQIAEVKPGIWYVNLEKLTPEYFFSKVPALANAKAIVFDMRGYPTDAVNTVLAHLTDKTIHSGQFNTPVYLKPDRQDVTYETGGWWTIQPVVPRFGGKIIFLTGSHAISYAESVMGTVAYNQLATIVGGPTAGTNDNVNFIVLPGGYSIRFTGMRVLAEDRSRFFGIGIKPDVPIEPTITGIRAGRDEVLDKAVAIASQAQ